MGNKKVTFNSRVKVLTGSGAIEYERDWGASGFDFLGGTSENLDFVQEQFEQKLSMLGYTGQEDLERIQELTMPMFRCANDAVRKIGALEYLKLLAEAPQKACGPAPTTNKPRGISVATLPEKKSRKRIKDGSDGKKRGVIRPKDVPGRDTPEQRKMRLMADRQEPKFYQKFTQIERGSHKKEQNQHPALPKPILKVTKNEYDDVVIIDLTEVDDGTWTEDEDDDSREGRCWSSHDDHSEDEREESEREHLASPISPATQESSRQSPRSRSPCRDPPSFDEFVEGEASSKTLSRNTSSHKPDPSASYHHQESTEELNFTSAYHPSKLYGHAAPITTNRSTRHIISLE
jgi:hypothetical protein